MVVQQLTDNRRNEDDIPNPRSHNGSHVVHGHHHRSRSPVSTHFNDSFDIIYIRTRVSNNSSDKHNTTLGRQGYFVQPSFRDGAIERVPWDSRPTN